MSSNLQKVTIYSRFDFMGNILSVEGHLVSITYRDSEGRKIPMATYIKKRARNESVIRPDSKDPFLVIVEGWDRFKPDELYDENSPERKADFIPSRYTAFDPRWTTDFVEKLQMQTHLTFIHKSGKIFDAAGPAAIEAESVQVPADPAGGDRCHEETGSSSLDGGEIEEAIKNLRAAKTENLNLRNEFKETRYSELAESVKKESQQLYKRARDMASYIPFAQPIKIGHYSEKSDRNYRDRIHNTYGNSFKAEAKAEHYRDKAESIGAFGISSSDGNAVSKLEVELSKREKTQVWMTLANATIKKLLKRKNLSAEALKKELPDSPESWCIELATPDNRGRYGYARYEFSNNGANIRRLKERIMEIKAEEVRGASILAATGEMFTEKSFGQITVTENYELNRIQIRFPRQEGKKAYSILRSSGFIWSPKNKAYQRLLNHAGRNNAGLAVDKLIALYPQLATKGEAPGFADTSAPSDDMNTIVS